MNSTDAPSVDSTTPLGWRWAPAWVLAYAALWPASRVSEAVLSLGALAALFLLAKARFRDGTRLLSSGAWALTTVLFFAYWTPQLISTFDAADMRGALTKTLAGLRYLPFLWLVAISVATQRGRRIVFGGIAVLLLVWSIDLLLQALSGRSVSATAKIATGPAGAIRTTAVLPVCSSASSCFSTAAEQTPSSSTRR